MLLIKCDKCGVVSKAGACDNDYICYDNNLDIQKYDVADTKVDLCKHCYNDFREETLKFEQEFIKNKSKRIIYGRNKEITAKDILDSEVKDVKD